MSFITHTHNLALAISIHTKVTHSSVQPNPSQHRNHAQEQYVPLALSRFPAQPPQKRYTTTTITSLLTSRPAQAPKQQRFLGARPFGSDSVGFVPQIPFSQRPCHLLCLRTHTHTHARAPVEHQLTDTFLDQPPISPPGRANLSPPIRNTTSFFGHTRTRRWRRRRQEAMPSMTP